MLKYLSILVICLLLSCKAIKPSLNRCIDSYPDYFALSDTFTRIEYRDSLIRLPAIEVRDSFWLTGKDSIIERTIVDKGEIIRMQIRYERATGLLIAKCTKEQDSLKVRLQDTFTVKTQYKDRIKIESKTSVFAWVCFGFSALVILCAAVWAFIKFGVPLIRKSATGV